MVHGVVSVKPIKFWHRWVVVFIRPEPVLDTVLQKNIETEYNVVYSFGNFWQSFV